MFEKLIFLVVEIRTKANIREKRGITIKCVLSQSLFVCWNVNNRENRKIKCKRVTFDRLDKYKSKRKVNGDICLERQQKQERKKNKDFFEFHNLKLRAKHYIENELESSSSYWLFCVLALSQTHTIIK